MAVSLFLRRSSTHNFHSFFSVSRSFSRKLGPFLHIPGERSSESRWIEKKLKTRWINKIESEGKMDPKSETIENRVDKKVNDFSRHCFDHQLPPSSSRDK